MLAINLYTVSMLALNKRNLPTFVQALLVFLCLVQVIISGAGLRPLVLAHRAMYSPVKLLFKSMKFLNFWRLQSHHHHLKWKVLVSYEVLTSGDQSLLAFSVGPISKVTKSALFQVQTFNFLKKI